ncbi:hypothetical protein [Psychrobium sp. 1_MG-2023]|uniref:condensin complex protein MksE n=1 Tax=Psychrobium sp. 1_MG-2023 TaxID=3062624 RepID=UPI000C31C55B|nr:hypothetical protein [Psychrobium sp. 1_MG-2023]MDP2560653.1 hypothetical protein [Psychrobium sp. 1_MG-2023]PKF56549.1 hypothetical protein CW748_08675 [Alteromonadales bacterium alter-6D02]
MIEHGPLLEALLAGASICQVTDEEAFRRLQDEVVREELNHFLRPLNRRLAQSQDGSVFFLAYQELNSTAREHLGKEFKQTVQSLLPLLEWMQLVQEALGRDGSLTAGDTIKFQEFALRTEDNQSLRQRFNQLAADRFFKSNSEQLDQQLKQVFKRLKETGYLQQPHKDRQYYIVTGKIEQLIELVRFIKDEESLPLDDMPQQESMF